MLDFSRLSNQALLAFWENIQRQIISAQAQGRRDRFVGEHSGLFMRKLKRELDRRQLQYAPIQSET
jgi:hypothetical protein